MPLMQVLGGFTLNVEVARPRRDSRFNDYDAGAPRSALPLRPKAHESSVFSSANSVELFIGGLQPSTTDADLANAFQRLPGYIRCGCAEHG